MVIYLYNKYEVKNPKELIKRICIKHYDISENAEISLSETGKPFFNNYPDVHFSISHTADVWAVAIANELVGFDIEQSCRKIANHFKIAKRFFTNEELEYVRSHGKKGFLQIWVRKEAILKMTGHGLKKGLDSFNLVEKNALLKELSFAYVDELDLGDGLISAYSIRNKPQHKGIKIYRRR